MARTAKTKQVKKRTYSNEERSQAAIQYAISGSLAQVERKLGIPDSTLCEWKQTEWWDALTGEIRSEKTNEHRAQYSQLVDEAIAVTRLKLPEATAAQAAVISGVAFDKIRLIDNMPTSIGGNSNSAAMQALADTFAKLSSRNKDLSEKVQAIEDTVVHTIDKE